jgi:hypothetical protein
MFFIGGFNSVIPYVVYLSLIWTFVILSFGGRIAAMLHMRQNKEITSEQFIYKSGDDHFLQCHHYSSDKQTQNITTASVPDLSQLSIYPTFSQQIRLWYDSPPLHQAGSFSFLLRGPPSYC